jgi:hypothetical protein
VYKEYLRYIHDEGDVITYVLYKETVESPYRVAVFPEWIDNAKLDNAEADMNYDDFQEEIEWREEQNGWSRFYGEKPK